MENITNLARSARAFLALKAGCQRLRRKINGALAGVFGLAGIKLLTSNV